MVRKFLDKMSLSLDCASSKLESYTTKILPGFQVRDDAGRTIGHYESGTPLDFLVVDCLRGTSKLLRNLAYPLFSYKIWRLQL